MDLRDRKRRRIEVPDNDYDSDVQIVSSRDHLNSSSRESIRMNTRRSISPPVQKKAHSAQQILDSPETNSSDVVDEKLLNTSEDASTLNSSSFNPSVHSNSITLIPSPVQLISIKDLPDSTNIDTISLHDILGNPLIRECWIFNFLFDIHFVMSQFDRDTRDLIKVKIVHGSWRNEDLNRIRINEASARYPNLQAITAYMPEAYGTHHSKMIILFYHDDQAQVFILTANMVAGDWRMCQAVWRSPLLPIQVDPDESVPPGTSSVPVRCGSWFKRDLIAYLRKYEARTKDLVSQLSQFDFSSVRAALIASAPGKQNLTARDLNAETLWGWQALQNVLSCVPSTSCQPHIVIQVSSIASIGDKWTTNTFFTALSKTAANEESLKSNQTPKFSIVFPTSDEIRRSIDGYSAGGSIHMKIQSAAQTKQLTFLRPMLSHWAGDEQVEGVDHPSSSTGSIREAGRRRAAPHIKTYVRFSDDSMTKIDWAMLTSANLSTQAWGAATNPAGEVRICSYEIGVIVWPALWDDGVAGSAEMVPVFKNDTPMLEASISSNDDLCSAVKTRVGWRMPYDLPLVHYRNKDMPWSAALPCDEPDWMGRTWPGFGSH